MGLRIYEIDKATGEIKEAESKDGVVQKREGCVYVPAMNKKNAARKLFNEFLKQQKPKTMTILITGAAGFMGSRFAKWLLENTEHNLVGVDNMSGGFAENLPPNSGRFWFTECDIARDRDRVENLFDEFEPTVCFHFAAYASEGRSNNIRSFIHLNNTIGTLNIINACVNHGSKLVFTSSVAVYSGEPPFNEETIPNPIDEYGLSKWSSEKSIEIAAKTQGLEYTIIRPRNVYGVGQNIFDPSRNLFGIFCYQTLNWQPLTIFGTGENKRSFTYIDDILEPIYKSMNFNNQVFNLGSKNVYTIKQAAQVFQEVTGYYNVVHTEPRHEVAEAFCTTEKSEQLLGYEDKTTLYSGLKKMWEWAKTLKMRPRQTPPPLETTKNAHKSLL